MIGLICEKLGPASHPPTVGVRNSLVARPMLLQLQVSNTTPVPSSVSPYVVKSTSICAVESTQLTQLFIEDGTSPSMKGMDMAEAAWRVGDADLAVQLLEEEARCGRELFDTSLAAAKQDVTEFIAAAHKRITSAAAAACSG
jgi:hypothetical protein